MFFSSLQGIFPPPKVLAAESRTVVVPSGTINKYMRWENPKIVNYPNSEYGNYPATISYDQDGFTGTLNAKRIILKPKQKEYHKDPIYRTEYQTFTKTYSWDGWGNNSDSNYADWIGIDRKSTRLNSSHH